MDRREYLKRLPGYLNSNKVQAESASIFGCGSGGCRVSEEIVRLGVENVFLVDKPGEVLEEHNIIRHTCGYSDLGRPKVEALRDRLLDINPECNVEIFSIDVTKDMDTLGHLIERSNQVFVCTDNEASRHVINHVLPACSEALPVPGST